MRLALKLLTAIIGVTVFALLVVAGLLKDHPACRPETKRKTAMGKEHE